MYNCMRAICLTRDIFLFISGAKGNNQPGMHFGVAQLVLHPQYRPFPPAGPFDIALIRLAGRVTNIPPVPLPNNNPTEPSLTAKCMAAGKHIWLMFDQYKKLKRKKKLDYETELLAMMWESVCLFVSELESGWRGLGPRPDQVIVLYTWEKHFSFTVPLSIQEY